MTALSTKPINVCLENDILKQMCSVSLPDYMHKSLVPNSADIPELCKCSIPGKYNTVPVLLSHKRKSGGQYLLYTDLGVVPVKVHFLECAKKIRSVPFIIKGIMKEFSTTQGLF